MKPSKSIAPHGAFRTVNRQKSSDRFEDPPTISIEELNRRWEARIVKLQATLSVTSDASQKRGAKPVMVFGQVFPSVAEAAWALGLRSESIQATLRGEQRKTYRGGKFVTIEAMYA
jgi:hypothetical protein